MRRRIIKYILLLLILLFSIDLIVSAPGRKYRFIQVESDSEEDDNKEYYIIYLQQKQAKRLPNIETLQYFFSHHDGDEHLNDIEDLPTIPRQFLSDYFPHYNVSSVPPIDFNDMKNATLTKIMTLSPPAFIWKENHNVFSNTFNPCLAYVNKGHKLLLAFRREIFNSPILFNWFDLKTMKILDDDYEYGVNPSLNYLDLPKKTDDDMNEDPRLFLRQDGTVSILYHFKPGMFAPVSFHYMNMSFVPRHQRRGLRGGGKWAVSHDLPEIDLGNKLATLTPTLELSGHSYPGIQKNWVMLEAMNATYFIQSLNPFHLLNHMENSDSKARLQVMIEKEEIDLPWTAEYGLPLRGGTPALLLKNLSRFRDPRSCRRFTPSYPHNMKNNNNNNNHQKPHHREDQELLNDSNPAVRELARALIEAECFRPPDSLYVSFFHTVAMRNHYHHHTVDRIRTYYMGAVTLCPSYPFDMYSISPHPILLEEYYQTEWASLSIDHVMFPIGLFQLPEEPDYLWISFGYEDKHGAIGKFHIFDLLKSMENVNNTVCV